MGRFLFVVPPLEGHVNPTVAVGRELAARGHRVAWTGHPEVVPALLPTGAEFLPVADRAPTAVTEAAAVRNRRPRGGAVGLKAFWDEFVLPIAEQMVPGVRAAVDAFRPDALVVDQHALAGAAVALESGLVWATSATTSADLDDPLAGLPRVQAWLRGRMDALLAGAGIDPAVAAGVDLRFSPRLLVAFTAPELLGRPALPGHWALVGPAVAPRPDATPFPWEALAGTDPLVLVTLGTVNWRAGARFFGVAAEALGGLDVRAVIVAPGDLVPDPPPNVLVVPRVPQLALLERTDLVVCHAGHNTVCEALAAGVPLVVAPVRDDQPFVADQVVRAGAGVRVKFGRVGVDDLRTAVAGVLDSAGHRAAAARLARALAGAGGAAAAADHVAGLLGPRDDDRDRPVPARAATAGP